LSLRAGPRSALLLALYREQNLLGNRPKVPRISGGIRQQISILPVNLAKIILQ
jgi:hypothetical protein